MRFNFQLFISVILVITLNACNRKGDKFISQGEIHYNIDYKGRFAYPTETLPRNLIVSFKDNKILFEMTGLGNSGIVNLYNPETGVYDTYYNFFGVQKYYYAGKEGEEFPGFDAMEGIQINKTSKTQQICGYECKNAIVTFKKDKNKSYSIWYTDEIKIEHPNAATPFNGIDGVLMAFFFIMGPSELHFMAEAVYSKDVPDDVFDRKEHYIRVSRSDMVQLMDDMLEKDNH